MIHTQSNLNCITIDLIHLIICTLNTAGVELLCGEPQRVIDLFET